MTRYRQTTGFTLIELLIVVAVIGILSAIAIPTYSRYVVKANRSEAQASLTEIMFEQERYQSRKRTYVTDLTTLGYAVSPVITENGHYSVAAAACPTLLIADCVLLTATPVAGGFQASHGEVALTLNSQGVKGGKWRR
ncbi:type IV pilin protein [Arenicella xantha]|uniref:Type IV pilus assembly protein PilE n=1 Tax=Arenicella xantha TaxID=644221 RepID=A0A395JPT9_9GAMM|nr:type IV pilin protein [Arenicella xantha]RBP52655.1 type IV pilus assembly protein PilE [Arenicella xantha]